MFKDVLRKSGFVYGLVYLLSLFLLPVTIVKGWLESPPPWFFLPISSGVMAFTFLIGSMGALFTIPLGIAVLNDKKQNVTLPFSKNAPKPEKILKITSYSVFAGVLLVGVSWGIGFLGMVLGEPAPLIEKVFVIPIANATIDFYWLIAIALFSFMVGITEEATFRLFGTSTLVRFLQQKVNHAKAWQGSIVITSLLFAAVHILPGGLWSQQPVSTFTRVFLTSLALGYLFKRRGYEASVIAHGTLDFLAFIGVTML